MNRIQIIKNIQCEYVVTLYAGRLKQSLAWVRVNV